MCDLCAKGFFNYEFNSADIDKISNFNEIASNFTYLCTSKFIKYNLTDTDHLLLKSKFYGKGKSGMYFCIFGSCQPLMGLKVFEYNDWLCWPSNILQQKRKWPTPTMPHIYIENNYLMTKQIYRYLEDFVYHHLIPSLLPNNKIGQDWPKLMTFIVHPKFRFY